jgi:hypothetical protein
MAAMWRRYKNSSYEGGAWWDYNSTHDNQPLGGIIKPNRRKREWYLWPVGVECLNAMKEPHPDYKTPYPSFKSAKLAYSLIFGGTNSGTQ